MSVYYETLRWANKARQEEWDPGAQTSASYKGNELGGEVGLNTRLL